MTGRAGFHLAEFNFGTLRHDWDDPRIAGFVAGLDRVNALAEGSPGFVWRLTEAEMSAAQASVGDRLASTLSVWEDVAALEHFVWNTLHRQYLGRKAEWYDPAGNGNLVLWWVPVGHRPGFAEAMARWQHWRDRGDSDHAFGWTWAKETQREALQAGAPQAEGPQVAAETEDAQTEDGAMINIRKIMRRHHFGKGDIRADIEAKYGVQGDLLDIYTTTTGSHVHKWHHYLPLYERYFGPWRKPGLRFLEIGVSRGGSLAMWRRYFGAEAVIFGIDINPACEAYNGHAGQVRIGSQADPDFLARVVDEMGGVDVVLDDGSHVMAHIEASLHALMPRLTMGGVYMIEDLHTAYWPEFGGGIDEEANVFNHFRRMVDDMHRWYHDKGVTDPLLAPMVAGIHIHDSVVVLDKARVYRPAHSIVGGAAKAT